MSCDTERVDRVYFVRWSEPTKEDVAQLMRELPAHRKAVGRPLLFIAVLPEDATVPGPLVRRALDDGFAKAFEYCEHFYFVVEGIGFKHTILRSVLTANILVSGRRGKMHIVSSVGDLVSKASPDHRPEILKSIPSARLRGIFRAVEVAPPAADRA
jgi:hypothetical protein